MAAVDLHILTCERTTRRQDWLAQAVASCDGQPVTIHLMDNAGTIGEGRATGLAEGNAEFVSWLDDDDWLLPGAVESCLNALVDHPEAVGAFTDELRYREGIQVGVGEGNDTGPWSPELQLTRISYARHLVVMRRAAVMPFLPIIAQHASLSEYVLRGLIVQYGPWIHVERDGYIHRQHDENKANITPTTPEQRKAAVDRVRPVLMPLILRDRHALPKLANHRP